MNEEIFYIEDGVEVAAPVLLKVQRPDRYGTVEGLPDEELADPDELERCVFRADLEAVFLLPEPKSKWYSPAWDTHADVDFNAFASVDFDRLRPEFDKARYKADKLREQLRDVLITFAMLNERVTKTVKYKLLKLIRIGRIEADQIKNWDMWQLAKYYLRAVRLCEEIRRLHKYSRDCREEKLQDMLDSLG
ncbi:MAG: hypothetical protein H8E17_21080 [Deltaproteobacteria bacterium]|nr:hypothetical protein [Deltaproteobacteria bacterium]